MNKSVSYVQLTLSWSNPYTAPPDGPRILWAVTLLDPTFETEAEKHRPYNVPGNGYSPTYGWVRVGPSRGWSPEAKAEKRLSNLSRRLQKNFPLLADELFKQETQSRPDYFDASVIRAEDAEMDRYADDSAKTFWIDAFSSPARPLRDIQTSLRSHG